MRMMEIDDRDVGPINVGNPGDFTIRHLAEMVIDLTGSASIIEHKPLPHDDPVQRRPDITRAEAMLGWRPTVQLEKGLKKTIAYFNGMLASHGSSSRILSVT
jgi:UDP-glucuronate decarboxylase